MSAFKKAGVGAAALLMSAMVSAPSEAALLSFSRITSNASQNVAGQLSVDVTSGMGGTLFKFMNSGPVASSITDIYFDDTTPYVLSNNFSFVGSFGVVDFDAGANPSNLPGGNAIGFSANFSADSDSPVSTNGIAPNEYLTILFAGANYGAVLDRIEDGLLRIGLHVQAIAAGRYTEGSSDSFVNNVPTPPTNNVPEPISLALMGSGLLGLGLARRRRQS